MEESKKSNNLNSNFQNFIKMQKEIMESFSVGANIDTVHISVDELFNFFRDHFNDFRKKENFSVVLDFIHRCIKIWITRGGYLEGDIGISLMYFMHDHRNEDDLNIVVQIVYQVMNSIKYFGEKDVPVSEKLLHELITIVPSIKNRTLLSSYIACIQLYLEMFPESLKILAKLWTNLKSELEINLKSGVVQDTEIDILIHLINEFNTINFNIHKEPVLVRTIKFLLKSDQKKYRKCGYYLFKKHMQFLLEDINTMTAILLSFDHNQQIERSFIMYITILVNLEEEQSHLILPSLENLKELVRNKHLESSWMEILYMRILKHNNNLVLRWSIEFFLKTFVCSDLSADTLKLVLQATNSNLLYNYENYFINTDYFSTFLNGNLTNLLTLLPEIENWKSVPLYIWLEHVFKMPKKDMMLTFELIIKICACVRKLQNCNIREKAIKLCNQIFKQFIGKMTMEEYVTYVETLYNSGDGYEEHQTLFNKVSLSIELKSKESIFKQRFYEIFTNKKCDNIELIKFLNNLQVEQQGWLKFAAFKQKILGDYPKYFFSCSLNLIKFNSLNLHDVISMFYKFLLDSPPYDKNELVECQLAAICFYIYEKENLKNEDEEIILNSEINQNEEVLYTLAKNILENNNKEINLWFIDELLKYDNKNVLSCVSNYLRRVYQPDNVVILNYARKIYENYGYIPPGFSDINLLENCTKLLLNVLASKGETRIEEAFCVNHFNVGIYRRHYFCKQIKTYGDRKYILGLLKYHTEITKKKPRYFENSNEHRIKLRIGICIFYAITYKSSYDDDIFDEIWNILLNENNQLNIVYIYEYILGHYDRRINIVLKKLEEAQCLTSRQQVSIISVAYTHIKCNPYSEKCEVDAVSFLLALSMVSNFQTRLLAQMSLYKLLKDDILQDTSSLNHIVESIEYAAGTKLSEYLNEIRLHIHKLSTHINAISIILHITNVPFDEMVDGENNIIDLDKSKYEWEIKQIESCRETFMKKFNVETNENTSAINNQIQRKLNPVNDFTEPHNLIVYPTKEKSAQMFVVASLIDKIPNLGGIARTCEVLGIQNFVMDSKKHTEKCDFKNLSMTAEKTLNILEVKPKDLKEFLMNKRLEGFSIVGAEQTNNSQNFNNFQFPQKCVLLLGHEKDGIPAPLLGLLDHAVEIPQFGQVRSLNVHVTGALFMWEYCKQHLLQQI